MVKAMPQLDGTNPNPLDAVASNTLVELAKERSGVATVSEAESDEKGETDE